VKHSGNLSLLVWIKTPDSTKLAPREYSRIPAILFAAILQLDSRAAALSFGFELQPRDPMASNSRRKRARCYPLARETFIGATYDGRTCKLYVNGHLEAETHMPRFRPIVRFPFEGRSAPMFAGLLSIGLFGLTNTIGQARMVLALGAEVLRGDLSSLTAPGLRSTFC
jgi:hypothetical protein